LAGILTDHINETAILPLTSPISGTGRYCLRKGGMVPILLYHYKEKNVFFKKISIFAPRFPDL